MKAIIMQYAESNAILLPGCIPGYKRDDIPLLPSSTAKKAVWLLYEESTVSNNVRLVAYTLSAMFGGIFWECGGV
jgi:hypothetical protein